MISFRKINPVDVLICENKEISLKISNYTVKELVINKIYIRYLIYFIFNFFSDKKLSLSECYKQTILNLLKPKILISNNLSGRGFEYKKLYPRAKLVFYQFGYVNKNFLIRKNISNFKNTKLDYFFTFHKQDTEILKKKFKANYIESGSVRNNSIFIKPKKIKKNKIVFISEYGPLHKKFLKNHSFVVSFINEFCKKNDFKLEIALRLNRTDKLLSNKKKNISVVDEIKYFNNLLKKKIEKSNITSIEKCSDANVIITLNSNLGIELLSRNKKVMFFYLSQIISKEKTIPYFKKKDCIFIHSNYKISEANKKLKKLIKIPKNKWVKIKKQSMQDVKFDEGNKIFKRKILQILKNEKN